MRGYTENGEFPNSNRNEPIPTHANYEDASEKFTADTGHQNPKTTDVDHRFTRLEQTTDTATQQQHQEMPHVNSRSTRLKKIIDTASEQQHQEMTDVDHRFTRLEQNTDFETNESTTSRATKHHVKNNHHTGERYFRTSSISSSSATFHICIRQKQPAPFFNLKN